VVEENKKKKEFVPTKKRYKIFVFSLKKKEKKRKICFDLIYLFTNGVIRVFYSTQVYKL
jgi:hypothetical protein